MREGRSLGAGALVVAGLYHRRRVVVRLRSVTLLDDHERDGPTVSRPRTLEVRVIDLY